MLYSLVEYLVTTTPPSDGLAPKVSHFLTNAADPCSAAKYSRVFLFSGRADGSQSCPNCSSTIERHITGSFHTLLFTAHAPRATMLPWPVAEMKKRTSVRSTLLRTAAEGDSSVAGLTNGGTATTWSCRVPTPETSPSSSLAKQKLQNPPMFPRVLPSPPLFNE